MTILHKWLSEKVLHTRYIDKITGDELLQEALETSGNPGFDNLRAIISDWSGAYQADISVEDVERLAAYINAIARTNPRIFNISVLTQNHEAPQALISLYEMYVADTPWQTAIAGTLEEAQQQIAHLII